MHVDSRSRQHGSDDRRALALLRALLDGAPDLAPSLGLDLDRHHIGLLAWGAQPAGAGAALARLLGCPLFSLAVAEGTVWAWLSAHRPLSPAVRRHLPRLHLPPATGLAIGLEGHGAAGFRASHRQALRARTMIRADPPKAIHYADVAVAALAAENPVDARAFVAHELRGIDDDSETSERLRETILAYFAAGHNAASAAAALGVHQQTVANRLRTAEERLGHAVGDRHVELETALRLRSFHGQTD